MVEKCPTDRPQTIAEVLRRVRGIRRTLRASGAATTVTAGVSEPAPAGPALAGAHLGDSPSPTPSPRVVVLRTRRGDETRPADAAAMELILATKARPDDATASLPPLDLSVGSAATPPTQPERAGGPTRPVAWAAAGIAAIAIGLVGLWFTVGQA
jgi:hypothetical protein